MPETIALQLKTAEQDLLAISDSPQLDAELLLSHCLGRNRSFLRAWPEQLLSTRETEAFQTLLQKRLQGTPIAYLLGEREFWSRPFKVTPDVLIPRPDTELIIELALQLLGDKPMAKLIDLGTGSGIIAVTLALEIPKSTLLACDISLDALAIAKHNATLLGAKNLSLVQSDWFSAIDDHDFDLVIANPPYIAMDDPHLLQGDVRFEPLQALISPDQGLKDIRVLTDQARRHLTSGGYLLIEHGYQQQQAVQEIFQQFDFKHVTTHCDLAGNPRVTIGQWQPL